MASLEEQRMMEDAPDSSVQVDTGSHWQRLATIAIMYFTVSNITVSYTHLTLPTSR